MAVFAVGVEGKVDKIVPVAERARLEVMGMTVLVDRNVEWKNPENPGSISTPT